MVNKDERYERWLKIEPNLFRQLPEEHQNYMLQMVEEHGRKKLAQTRTEEFNSWRKNRLSPTGKLPFQIVVTVIGALTFSLAPGLIGKHSGRGIFAISMGLVGGATASYFAHENAAKVLAGQKLKQSTRRVKKNLDNRSY